MSLNLETTELRPMAPDAQFLNVSDAPTVIEIRNPRHFVRTLQFAEDNGLLDDFNRSFDRLLQLLLIRPGSAIWPDGKDTPSFMWRGAGMVGGFIFHERSRDWSIHT